MQAKAIFGRSSGIDTVLRDLSRARLVTISGPGGIGKTTLAIGVVDGLRSKSAEDVSFVDLAPIEKKHARLKRRPFRTRHCAIGS